MPAPAPPQSHGPSAPPAAAMPSAAAPRAQSPGMPVFVAPRGRSPSDADRRAVAQHCAGLATERSLLIEHLHRIQDAEGGLRRGRLAALAERLGLSQVEVYEVASFYHHFRILADDQPAPRLTVRICTSLPCTLAGGADLLATVRQHLALKTDIAIEAAPCMGQCHRAPAACVGQRQLDAATADAVLATVAAPSHGPRALPARGAPAQPGDFAQLQRLLSGEIGPSDVLHTLRQSDLRGMGGAGFAAWRKWETVLAQPGPRELVVNIDEGEVGTFKDWHLLAHEPRPFLEGMLIAARLIGAGRIWIYLRDEYHDVRALLTEELARLRQHMVQWQQAHPEPPWPDISLRRGAGAYICGEESALIESLEGKRGMPRLKPPIVAVRGLFGRPTLAHNVETLWWIPQLLAQGADWWQRQGLRGRKGLRRFSVSGRVARPGLYLAPAGITANELITQYAGGMAAGHTLYAYFPGGASGGLLPASLADLPLDFETLQPHGAFVGSMALIVLSQHDRARWAADEMLRFLEHESCGQCTPCRAGITQLRHLVRQPQWDRERLAQLSQTLRDASICGLGQAAPNPIDAVLRHFPHEISSHVHP